MKQELINATEQNNIDKIKTLVESGADINTAFVRGEIPEKSSADKGSSGKRGQAIVNTLLNVGTFGLLSLMNDMFAQGSSQPVRSIEKPTDGDSNLKYYAYSPLSYAVKNNNLETTEALINLAADVNIAFEDYKADDAEIIRYTPLAWAIINSNLKMAELLLGSGASANKAFQYGSLCPLNMAIMDNNLNIVNMLLSHGANPNIITADKFSPLGCAISKGNIKMMKVLIEHKADVNTMFGGYSPLGYAVVVGNLEIVRLLIDSGADTSATFTHHKEEYSPLDYAKKDGHSQIIELLSKL